MRTLAFMIVALAVQSAAAQEIDRIGTTALAANEVEGRRSGTPRGLKVGDSVFRNEEIRTGKAGKAQLLFLDETVFTLGPNSVAVLDSFVYDPDKKKGLVSLHAVRGAFRFVSGVGPKENYRIMTPHGTVGVRGTDLTLIVSDSELKLELKSGMAELCSGSNCVKVPAGSYVISSGNSTTRPQPNGTASCGGSVCRQEFTDNSPLVVTYIGDIVSQQAVPDRGALLPPGQSPRGHGFFGPRP